MVVVVDTVLWKMVRGSVFLLPTADCTDQRGMIVASNAHLQNRLKFELGVASLSI